MEASRPHTLETINDDVFHEICKAILDTQTTSKPASFTTENQSIISLSMTSRRMRKQLEPIVFRSIRINYKSWHLTREALEDVRKCRAAHEYMRRLYIRVHDAAEGSLQSVDGLPQLFASVLRKSQKLEALSVAVPLTEAEVYRQAILHPGPILASVRTLVLSPQMEWMVDLCPCVTNISTTERWPHWVSSSSSYSSSLITAAGRANNLRHFEMAEWSSMELIEQTLSAMPGIQSLVLKGTLETKSKSVARLTTILTVLSRFTRLTALSLPRVSQLSVGFFPPMCGNAYMGPDGAKFRERIQEQRLQAEQKASRMVFSSCPQLEVLWLGDSRKSTPFRNNAGTYLESVIVTEDRPKIY